MGERGGAEVVMEAGQGELGGSAGASELGVALEDLHAQAGLGEGDRGGEAVGSGADDVGCARLHLTGWMVRGGLGRDSILPG